MALKSVSAGGLVVLLLLYVASLLAQGAAKVAPAVSASRYASVGTNNFDPRDLCKTYDDVFKAAGVPNVCTVAQRNEMAGMFGTITLENKNTGEIIAEFDYAKESSNAYKGLIPDEIINSKRNVWSISVHVFSPYDGKGFGSAIIENYSVLAKTIGIQSGDFEVVVASPARSMPLAKQEAWTNLIKSFCLGWRGAVMLSEGIGCYRMVP